MEPRRLDKWFKAKFGKRVVNERGAKKFGESFNWPRQAVAALPEAIAPLASYHPLYLVLPRARAKCVKSVDKRFCRQIAQEPPCIGWPAGPAAMDAFAAMEAEEAAAPASAPPAKGKGAASQVRRYHLWCGWQLHRWSRKHKHTAPPQPPHCVFALWLLGPLFPCALLVVQCARPRTHTCTHSQSVVRPRRASRSASC